MTVAMVSRVCPTCKMDYALPRAVYEGARASDGHWFCPNGHKLHFPKKAPPAPAEPDPVRRDLELANAALRARVAALEADCTCALELAQAESDERRRLAQRLTSAHSRARTLRRERNSGVCPWCQNRFENLSRHLAAKHTGFIQAQRHIA